MKKYIIHTKTNSILTRFPALGKRLTAHQASLAESGGRLIASLGADLEKAGAAVAVQAGLTEPIQLGVLSREEIVQLVGALRELGWHCAVGLEACGFGWAFPRELRAAGAEVFTFATEALTGRRKTNQRDAAALARLVAERVVHGNLQSGRVVRELWRLLRWEPGWHGFQKWGAVLRSKGSTVRKKKAAIACVRLLFIDLWRLFTGHATLADLGFHGPPLKGPAAAAAI